MISVYKSNPEISLSPRRIETIEKYNKIIQLGRRNPVWFIEEILGVKLLDYQKYVVASSWDKATVCWVFSRAAGKSMLGGLYITAKSLLYPSHETYIMAGTAKQSQDTFMKIENFANKNIASIKNSHGEIVLGELEKNSAIYTGFSHNKDIYVCRFHNGSLIQSMIGDEEHIVGKRSNLNVYDEAGKLSHKFFDLTEPFTAMNTDFATGADIDISVLPNNIPTQCLYMSSAEDVNSHLFTKYKSCAKGMIMGRKDVFVADLNCEVPMHPTMNGKPYKPLLAQAVVDEAMSSNEYKALREYYNIFDTNGGIDCLVGRDIIRKNEKAYLPVFRNQGNPNILYGIFYDPAQRVDNSFVLIGEFFKDEKDGWKCRIINGRNFLTYLPTGEKKTMRATEQLAEIRKLMLNYNGDFPDWQKIHLFIDPGSGGGGNIYADFLAEDFIDEKGRKHCGIIDMEDDFYKTERSRIPHAIEKVLRLLNAKRYKNAMFEAAQQMIAQDLVIFPMAPSSGHKIEIDGVQHTLTLDQLKALTEIDLMKEEFLLMRKMKTKSENIVYALAPQEQNRAHDDRAYTLAALCYYLQELRREDQFSNGCEKTDMSILLNKIGKKSNISSPNKALFSGYKNNFTRR